MDLRPHLVVLWMAQVLFSPIQARERTMRGTAGAYCNGPVQRQTVGLSAVRCARECSSDSSCAAYSMQSGSQCLLHDDFCSPDDLVAEPGSLYVEVKLECRGSSCYYMPALRTLKTKSEADAVCEAMEAHVVATETQEENDLILQLVYNSSYFPATGSRGHPSIWLDLVNDVTWQHSGKTATFADWLYGEPMVEEEDCTIMMNTADGGWADVPCDRIYGFLCEK